MPDYAWAQMKIGQNRLCQTGERRWKPNTQPRFPNRRPTLYKCGIRFKNLQPDEAGEWRCEMEEYYDGYGTNRGNGATDERSFFIEVEAKTTTTTAATTASSNAAAVDARSLARNATSTAVLVAVSSAAASAAGDRKHTTAAVALIGSLICGMGFLMVNLRTYVG